MHLWIAWAVNGQVCCMVCWPLPLLLASPLLFLSYHSEPASSSLAETDIACGEDGSGRAGREPHPHPRRATGHACQDACLGRPQTFQ